MRKGMVKVISGMLISVLFFTLCKPVFSQNINDLVKVKFAHCELAASVSMRADSSV